ncbi:ABC transporter permease [Nonomuraea sp. NPDC051941]|uniref:ABC transporter permease n=1 Tax=Nonomuraea sp. NPDC051941 TaxID=3364373 RepID=UPI0037CCBFA8
MTTVLQALRTLSQASVIARADMKMIYTWKTWLGAWLVRLLCQVAFYGVIGASIDVGEYQRFVILGAVMVISATEPMAAVASTTWDRVAGTTPLLAASPVYLGFFYFGRSIQWPASACVTTTTALLVMSPIFGVAWSASDVPTAILLIALTSFATYGLALALGAAALMVAGARNIISNVTVILSTAFCGVVVPVSFWPPPVGWVVQAVPLTHGVNAIRDLAAGEGASTVAASAMLIVVTGVGWVGLAFLANRIVFAYSRHGGRLSS